ncbi:hypothetical protein [Vibrio parahaemolyticus]|uniref:hypothetical protein n=1 Tax=Vibrio parahaemolyticus TaxID=670 RepID=UPI00084A6936|nr:hypothetical protein [Vibrio parahaemolyticus]EGR3353104.1 hypothetical protein [Vibrio parahaemolyticus]EJG1850826.1 hypothetical protein [Vibrio parahaemolyticus]ODZ77125.1 hypothetical protein BBM46_08000 [Vibrio parahaemolyticus]OEA17892.1 hypothetical protein BBM54_03825 [Vibrio parahaemolyticus]
MKNTTPQSIVPNLDEWPVGSHERLINGYWELGMMRFHTFTNKCGEDLQNTYNRINNGLGVQTIYIDLLSLAGEDYRNKSQIMDIIRSDKPTWIWFINCEALLNGSLASWLRSILTTYNADHIRVTFVLDNQEQFSSIFQRYSAPLYQSTMALDLQNS